MVFRALEHVERFPKCKIAHDVESVKVKKLRYVEGTLTRLTDVLLQLAGEDFQAVVVVSQSYNSISALLAET